MKIGMHWNNMLRNVFTEVTNKIYIKRGRNYEKTTYCSGVCVGNDVYVITVCEYCGGNPFYSTRLTETNSLPTKTARMN